MAIDRVRLGWIGAVAGVAAGLFVAGENVNRSNAARNERAPQGEAAPALNTTQAHGCDITQIEQEPWKLISGYVSGDTDTAPSEFLIATVPDPQTTNLALFFDRSIESLMWAIGDSGYTFERYWFPWRAAEASYSSLADQECSRKQIRIRHAQPGLMIFRRRAGAIAAGTHSPGRALILFLVGESPVRGLNEDQLSKALDYVSANSSRGSAVRVAGPNFSGSLGPLAAFLDGYLAKNAGTALHFASPSVTSREAICTFRGALQKYRARISDEYVLENDERAGELFFSYIQKKWLAPRESGLLSEDDTAYGSVADSIVITSSKSISKETGSSVAEAPACPSPELQESQSAFHKWLSIRYPRQIARLRSTAQEPDAEQSKAETAPSASVVEETRFSLRDQEQNAPLQKDEPPIFSRLQSPASQQGALLQISSALRREHVEYTGIIATDVLDTLFLTRFLRLSFPDTRVFTFDSDLLFLREGETAPFDGVLAITTYPLIARNQHWTNAQLMGGIPRRVPFTARSAQGTYNAARYLLRDLNTQGELLLEYARPVNQRSRHPPLWLMVVGHDSYWPVALLDEERPDSSGGSLLRLKSPAIPREMLHPESPSEGWYLFTSFVLALALLHCLYVLAGSWRFKPFSKLMRQLRRNLTSILRPYPSNAISSHENPFLVVASLVLFCVLYFLVIVTMRFRGAPPTVSRSMTVTVITVTVLLLVVALSLVAGLVNKFRSLPRQHVTLVAAAMVCAALFCWAIFGLVYDETFKTGYFFAYRSLVLTSGVSPALPMIVLAVPYFYWAWMQLRREKLSRPRRRYVRTQPVMAEEGVAKLVPDVQKTLDNVFDSKILVLAVILTALWVVAVQPWNTIRSIEPYQFDFLYWSILVLLFYMVAVAWVHLIVAWKEFRVFLVALERRPIRDAFSRLRKQITWAPLVAKPPEHQLLITVLCGETLKAICSAKLNSAQKQQEWLGKRAEIDGLAEEAIAKIEAHEPYGMEAGTYIKVQRLLDDIAFVFIRQLQNHEWREGESESLKYERTGMERKRIPETEQLLILIEEFIAYRYLMFIRYTFRHLRNLLVFVVVGFIFMIVSLESYPFEAQHWIGVVAVITFLLFGIGIGYVFAQMDKDAILSRLTDTKANELSKNFAFRLLQFGTLPLLTVLTAQFPAIHRALASVLQPALEALK